MTESQRDRLTPTPIERADQLLRAFAEDKMRLTLTEIARRSKLPKSTVHRMVQIMLSLGWLYRDQDAYMIGAAIYRYGHISPVETRLRRIARPYLRDLMTLTQGTVHFAIREGSRALYVEELRAGSSVTPSQTPPVSLQGKYFALDDNAIGRVLMAFSTDAVDPAVPPANDTWEENLDAIRHRKLAHQDPGPGRDSAFALPVLLPGRVTAYAAIGVSWGEPPAHIDQFVSAASLVAQAIGRALSGDVKSPLKNLS